MIKHLLRKFRRTSFSPSLTKQHHCIRARLTHERLEPRLLLTINPSGAELLVNDLVPGFQGMDGNVSSVAVSEAAGTIVTYAGLGAGTREGIFLRRTDPTGLQSDVVRVSTTIRGARSNAVVAANDAGDIVVVWQGRGLGDKYGIYLQRIDASGDPLGGEQLVNETIGGKQLDPSVAMAADGSFVVSWNGASTSDSSGIYARRYSTDGTPLAGEELVNTTTAERQIESAIAVNRSGDYVITWSSRDQDASHGDASHGDASDGDASDGDASDWGVFGQRFNAAGVRQGSEFAINTTAVGSQRESSVAMQDDGTFMVVWSSFGQDGDSWAVVGQRFDATGTAVGGEFIVNSSTIGHQRHAQVAGEGGNYLVTWQSGVPGDISGWEVMAQQFDATGTAVGSEITVNSVRSGPHSGHQEHPAVALNSAGSGAIVWSGFGSPDRQGVYGRGFQDDEPTEENLTPDLATIGNDTVAPDTELSVTVTATDPNEGDILTYQLDPTHSPAGATITRNDNNTAVIRWTPAEADANSIVSFRVLVTDNGVPQLADAEEFQVNVTEGSITLDLNGSDESGADTSAPFAIGLGPASILPEDLLIVGAADNALSRVSIQLTATPNRSQEILEVDPMVLAGTNIDASYSVGLRRLFLSGVDSVDNYERVLTTLTYNNTATNPSGTRTVEIQVNDAIHLSNKPAITINLGTADLVGFAQALEASNTEFYGAGWCPHCTEQKELFEDGAQFLPFNEVTNPDRTPNDIADANDIDVYPTWIFPDKSRLENVQSLRTIANRSGVAIPISDTPFIAPIANDTLLVGSPLHVSLDGYDPNGGPLTYSVTTNRPADVEASILENIAGNNNRSARVNVAGYGDLVFELFEQRASRPTERFIELASDDLANDNMANNDFFYDDVIFHRVINDFVIQGGDPDGTGSGGTGIDFDDQFHVDLQHNRTGLLSYAKSLEDTNDSQFFITEGASATLRNLDFHHSIFGVLVEGEGNRAAISDTEVIRRASEVPPGDRRADRPGSRDTGEEFNIKMENVEIFEDTENAVLLLKANPGVTGDVIVTVTATDQQGNTFDREFTVTLQEDTVNGRPFFNNEEIVAPASVARGTSAQIQLAAASIDVENNTIFYGAEIPAGNIVPYTFTVNQDGVVDITLTDPNATGTLQINVMTAASTSNFAINPLDGSLGRSRRDGRVDLQLITIDVV